MKTQPMRNLNKFKMSIISTVIIITIIDGIKLLMADDNISICYHEIWLPSFYSFELSVVPN